MSRFVDLMLSSAESSTRDLVTGEPDAPVRWSWGEVHRRARKVAGGLAVFGVGPGDRVGVLAGAPGEIAPTAQGVWLRGACLTMLHQPTPRIDLKVWAQDTLAVIAMIEAAVVIVSDPFMATVEVLAECGVTVVTIAELMGAAPSADVWDSGEDDLALLQLTSGSTGCPKAVAISHANVIANGEAMVVGCRYDVDTDVIVSWLPLFHDMGMTGFLTVPMLFGGALVKITPMDFLADILLWPKLIHKHHGTMTAAPNFAYALLTKRLRRHAKPGDFDLSSLRWALSGSEPVDPADVEDLCDAGSPFGLRPEAIVPAYGMAETTVAVSFSQCGGGLVVDEVDADMLGVLRRAVPATTNIRRLAALGPVLGGMEVRIVDTDGAVQPTRGVGLIEVRGDPVTSGYVTTVGFVAAQNDQGWFDTGDLGYLTEQGHVVVCGRAKDVIIMAGRSIYPTDVERAAGRVAGVRAGCVAAVRLDAGHSRESFAVAVESHSADDPAQVRRIKHEVAHEVVTEVAARPRNVVVLAPGAIPKTPSGKLRRAHALSLVS